MQNRIGICGFLGEKMMIFWGVPKKWQFLASKSADTSAVLVFLDPKKTQTALVSALFESRIDDFLGGPKKIAIFGLKKGRYQCGFGFFGPKKKPKPQWYLGFFRLKMDDFLGGPYRFWAFFSQLCT